MKLRRHASKIILECAQHFCRGLTRMEKISRADREKKKTLAVDSTSCKKQPFVSINYDYFLRVQSAHWNSSKVHNPEVSICKMECAHQFTVLFIFRTTFGNEFIYTFKCAFQAIDHVWVRSDINPLTISPHSWVNESKPNHNTGSFMPYSLRVVCGCHSLSCVNIEGF